MDGQSINRFVFAITVLGVFVVLVTMMAVESPSLFAEGDKTDYESYLPPNYLDDVLSAEDIRSLLYWGNCTMSRDSGSTITIVRGGEMPDIDLELYWQHFPFTEPNENFVIHKVWWQWYVFKQLRDVLPENPQNPRYEPQWLCEQDIFFSENLDSSLNFSRIEMYDDSYNYVLFVTFDEESYDSLEEAVEDGELLFTMGMGWEYESALVSGWDLIARLLAFQAPNIHPYVNAIIAIPLIALISVLIFTIAVEVVKALPFT